MSDAGRETMLTRVRFEAADGYPLGGFLHAPARSDVAQAVVLATGAGLRAELYRHFATFLARHGIATLAFDYRGIGESRPARLRDLAAGFEDWAELDAEAAIAWIVQRYPDAALTGIGHSIGALLIGAPASAERFSQLVLIAPHVGFHGDYGRATRWLVRAAWGYAGPPLRLVCGYFPARVLRLGDDLPARVAVQWASYTSAEMPVGAGGGDPTRARALLDHVAQLRKPALALSASDDGWATEAGGRRILVAYRNLLVVRRVVAPADLGRRRIGHWGLFRRSAADVAWPIVLRFIAPPTATLRAAC